MRFKEMPHRQQLQWLRWANSHDWGQSSDARFMSDGTMRVESAAYDRINAPIIETFYAASPAELRAWAGY